MTIYESDRITVTVNTTNQSKVTISDKFSGASMSMNREAFEEMCKGVAEKKESVSG